MAYEVTIARIQLWEYLTEAMIDMDETIQWDKFHESGYAERFRKAIERLVYKTKLSVKQIQLLQECVFTAYKIGAIEAGEGGELGERPGHIE